MRISINDYERMETEIERLRAGLERARGVIQTLSARLPPADVAAQRIVDEELKRAADALHPPSKD